MLKLLKKGRAERTWCVEHRRLYEGKRCPGCVRQKDERRKLYEYALRALGEKPRRKTG